MTSSPLTDRTIAILAADGVERVELTEPRQALLDAGATVELVSPKPGTLITFDHFDRAGEERIDKTTGSVSADDYDGLLIPGGVHNPDQLRADDDAVRFVRAFFAAGKPVAAICHGPWVLAEADVLRDRIVTSFPSIRTDLRNAGATWVDEEVVVDEGLTTSRSPSDLPAFNAKLVEEFAEGRHPAQARSA
ncbi:type 1 glutamine amidotransferase domain-containing protein [Patulibacter defluvii]|uniref:type 1 glutamine amidotransferase domain-containing protein n=1 Tax=Patulibacter defluvii TaxID=3095358 RepID=UPI002A761C05|nr:type 1 glutamine amidotransferase domain-containing protein [Patulibacter sp. DM4]